MGKVHRGKLVPRCAIRTYPRRKPVDAAIVHIHHPSSGTVSKLGTAYSAPATLTLVKEDAQKSRAQASVSEWREEPSAWECPCAMALLGARMRRTASLPSGLPASHAAGPKGRGERVGKSRTTRARVYGGCSLTGTGGVREAQAAPGAGEGVRHGAQHGGAGLGEADGGAGPALEVEGDRHAEEIHRSGVDPAQGGARTLAGTPGGGESILKAMGKSAGEILNFQQPQKILLALLLHI